MFLQQIQACEHVPPPHVVLASHVHVPGSSLDAEPPEFVPSLRG